MEIGNGKIVVNDDGTEDSYRIDQITVEMEEDIHDVIGIVRCSRITVESTAPREINLEAECLLFQVFADSEYNNTDGSGEYRKQIKEDISARTGVEVSRIEVE